MMSQIRSVVIGLIAMSLVHGSVQAATPPQNEEAMTNQTIIELVKAKTSDDLLINLIKQSKTDFDTSAKGVLQLKKAGVSDAVIEAMMAKEGGKPTASPDAPSASAAGEPSAPPPGLPTEIGVYVKKDEAWADVLPEVVNWKTGGVLKSVVTAGVVKGDINGKINGPHSRNHLKTPIEFLIIAPEGVAITEYQFLRLREKKETREFRTVTGGVFHASGGATRDLVPFEGKKIAPRTFTVSFPTLPPGEYGFLPPGAFTSASAASSLGKMYTFNVGSEL